MIRDIWLTRLIVCPFNTCQCNILRKIVGRISTPKEVKINGGCVVEDKVIVRVRLRSNVNIGTSIRYVHYVVNNVVIPALHCPCS